MRVALLLVASGLCLGLAAAAAPPAAERVAARRLNRVEYQNTLRDVLGIQIDVQDLLPEDTSSGGFDNVAEGQHVSSFLMERYLEAAHRALNLAIANTPRPPILSRTFDCAQERHVLSSTERVYRRLEDGLALFTSSAWHAMILRQFYPPDRGRYRFRLRVSAVQSGAKPVTFRVIAGPMLMGTRSRMVGYFDAPVGGPGIVEFTEHLEARSTISILPYGLASAQAVHREGAEAWQGPGLVLHGIEVEGPLHERWPPESHRRLFGDLPQQPVDGSRGRLEVVSAQPVADAGRVLRSFLRRAYRRPVTEGDLQPLLALVRLRLTEGRTFEQAVRVALAAALVSPDFLFLREAPGKLSGPALASRLSYFLWSSPPDDELLGLGEQNRLGLRETLDAQLSRMLADPRSEAFVANFTGQWLGLRDIDFTEPSHILYPEFDDLLKTSMVREAELFFQEVLSKDLSLTNFVASDFSMLNGRLARHYGIPGVEGGAFRRVALPAGSRRGGVLTMAGVLKVTANGTATSPVTRGAWVLERILGTPPPRPPADVPAIEPDIRGATTIREQLAKHRADPSCAGCHALIDPPGFALESFDVIGGWRAAYRTTGRGKPVSLDGRRMPYLEGPAVDPSGTLRSGEAFKDIDELKRLLLRDRDQLARAMASRLLTYATGAVPRPEDRSEIEAIVGRIRPSGYGLRSLVREIVRSRLFQEK